MLMVYNYKVYLNTTFAHRLLPVQLFIRMSILRVRRLCFIAEKKRGRTELAVFKEITRQTRIG